MIDAMYKVFEVMPTKNNTLLQFSGNESCIWRLSLDKNQVIELANDLLAIANEMVEEVKDE